MASQSNNPKVIVCGAGPVGALAALYAAKRGDDVHIYELRDDLRDNTTTPLNFTRSINLALSERGISALRSADLNGLLEHVFEDAIPMHARMIHGGRQTGEIFQESQKYDALGRYIRSVDRAGLNKCLLNALDSFPNVTLHFNHKLTGANFEKQIAWFEQIRQHRSTDHIQNSTSGENDKGNSRAPEISVSFDFFIGADGAHSATRFHLMKYARLFYQQQYINTLWCEFRIAPTKDNGFAIDPNHLHIWPAGSFMFIAIPSPDHSFTCTLFASATHFTSIAENPWSNLPNFFKEYFPGVCSDLIPTEELLHQFQSNPHLPLVTLKCSPYHYKSSVVIVGDAAHAMVPFYGQGMNAGLEDIRVLFSLLDAHGVYDEPPTARSEKLRTALSAYTAQRAQDAHTINDLAFDNYREMSSNVRSPLYKLRKWLEETISIYAPWTGWRTQYTRVSFETQRYSDVEKEVKRQGRVLAGIMGTGFLGLGLLAVLGIRRFGGYERTRYLRDIMTTLMQ